MKKIVLSGEALMEAFNDGSIAKLGGINAELSFFKEKFDSNAQFFDTQRHEVAFLNIIYRDFVDDTDMFYYPVEIFKEGFFTKGRLFINHHVTIEIEHTSDKDTLDEIDQHTIEKVTLYFTHTKQNYVEVRYR